MLMRGFLASVVLLGVMTVPALADPIEGSWRRPNGHTVVFAACGCQEILCPRPRPGPNAGKSVGVLTATGG